MNAGTIIARWPSVAVMAQETGRDPQAVYTWRRRGWIPSRADADIIMAAERRGITVTLAELIATRENQRGAA